MSASSSEGSTVPESIRANIFALAASVSISMWARANISSSSPCFLKAISFILLPLSLSSLSTSNSAYKTKTGKRVG
ncbi:hypothetical protein HanIR_Chr05g0251661 [Helianthus annuus]|nr:hypothetical protein HanIR_Chr05g0251661 [Helianthus annuus]